jgi:hypothetical protein
MPGVTVDFRSMNKGELNQVAEDLNLDISGLKTEDLITRLEVLVYGEAKPKPQIKGSNPPKTKENTSE